MEWKLGIFMNVHAYTYIPKDLYLSYRMNQIKDAFTTFFRYLRGSSLGENIDCLISTIFSEYSVSHSLIRALAEWIRYRWPWERGYFHSIIQSVSVKIQYRSQGSFLPPDMRMDPILLESKGEKLLQYTRLKQLRNNETCTLFSFM